MHEAGAAMAFGEEREPAYRLDRLTSDRPQRERPAVAAAAVGLLAVGVIVLLHAGAYPTAPCLRLLPQGVAAHWVEGVPLASGAAVMFLDEVVCRTP
jgi:hypothetical protein